MKPTKMRAQQIANALSTSTLKQFLGDFPRILKEDDDLKAAGKPLKYGARVYGDFQDQANAIENALKARGEPYTPVDWS